MGALTLLLGGQKSGKSSAAMRLARNTPRSVRVVAPAMAGDDELAERIARHREDRRGDVAVDETFDVATVLATHAQAAVVIDALDTWLLERMDRAGLLDVGTEPTPLGTDGRAAQAAVLAEVDDLVAAALARPGPTWVIAGMVGMGMHGGTPAARRYEDLHGLATQRLGLAADAVLLMIAGRAVDLADLDVLPKDPL